MKMSNVFVKHINNEDSDSFHSFNESEYSDDYSASLPSDGGNDEAANKETVNTAEKVITKSTSVPNQLEVCCNALQIEDHLTEYEAPNKPANNFDQSPKSIENTSKTPKMEEFDMDSPKPQSPLSNASAWQKYAFTKIWIGSQQPLAGKRSLTREFTAALDAYFNETHKKNLFSEPTKAEKAKGEENIKLFVNEPRFVNAESINAEPYVSPFEDMPTAVPQSVHFPGEKKPTIVPAGFDLTSLVKYNDPNHWHRRPTTRNVDNI